MCGDALHLLAQKRPSKRLIHNEYLFPFQQSKRQMLHTVTYSPVDSTKGLFFRCGFHLNHLRRRMQSLISPAGLLSTSVFPLPDKRDHERLIFLFNGLFNTCSRSFGQQRMQRTVEIHCSRPFSEVQDHCLNHCLKHGLLTP
jgi:hypothetical protein